MTVAIILGGAKCVHEDIAAALKLYTPDITIAVKDIGITWPHVDHWVTLHPERVPKELGMRRASGLPDPKILWTYRTRVPKNIDLPVKLIDIKGGSSGLLGVQVALEVADHAVLCGVPLDPKQVHYKRPKKGGWPPAKMYRLAWSANIKMMKGRIKSMSGWTKELLGEPTQEWLHEAAANPPAAEAGSGCGGT